MYNNRFRPFLLPLGALIGVLVCILSSIWHYHEKPIPTAPLTNKEIYEIYNNLYKYTGSHAGDRLPLYIDPYDPYINAYSVFNKEMTAYVQIRLTQTAINSITKQEVAFLLGHELGHVMLMHDKFDGTKSEKEGAADKYSIYLMLRAGYDPCHARDFWARLINMYGDYQTSITHPSMTERYWSLSFPNCGDTK